MDETNIGTLLQIGANNIKQLLGCIHIERVGIFFAVDEVRPDMILDDFGHQPRDRTAHSCEQVHHFFAFGFTLKSTFDRFDLAPHTADTSQKSLFFTDSMDHLTSIAYPPTLFQTAGHDPAGLAPVWTVAPKVARLEIITRNKRWGYDAS